MTKTIPKVDEKKLEVISKKVGSTADTILDLKINDDRDFTYAGELLSQANKQAKEIKADKETLTKPLNAVLLLIRKKYKPVETQLEKAIKHLRSEVGRYQTLKDDEAEAKKASIAERIGSGKGKLKVETAAQQMANVEEPEKSVSTESGSISFKDDYEITVIDIKQIPEQFLTVDIPGIKKAFKAGGTVAGVDAKKVKIPINRTA